MTSNMWTVISVGYIAPQTSKYRRLKGVSTYLPSFGEHYNSWLVDKEDLGVMVTGSGS